MHLTQESRFLFIYKQLGKYGRLREHHMDIQITVAKFILFRMMVVVRATEIAPLVTNDLATRVFLKAFPRGVFPKRMQSF